MEANVNQKLTNLSLHQPGFAPNPYLDDIIYEEIENYQNTPTDDSELYVDMTLPANTPTEDSEVYVDMTPPANMAQREDVYEQYVEVQPPTLVHSKSEEDYELYVDVEQPKSHSGQPQEVYMDVLPQSNETIPEGESFYEAINYEAITSLRNPTTLAINKMNVTQSLPGRPLPRTPDAKPKRKAPLPPQAKLKTQSSVTVDNRPPSLKPQLRQSSLPAEPPAVHMRSTYRQTEELQNTPTLEHLSQTENTIEESPPLPPKPTLPSRPPNPAPPARPPKPTPQNAAVKELAHASPIPPSSQQNVKQTSQAAPIIAKRPPPAQVVRASVERTAPKPPQASSPGTGPKPASFERAASPNPKYQKAISSGTETKPAVLVQAPSSVAPPTTKSITKPQVQEHEHNLPNKPVPPNADSVPNVNGHSDKVPYDNQDSESLKPQCAVSIAYHAEGPVQPDQKVGHSPSPVAHRLPRHASEPILPFEAPPPYSQIYPQQPYPQQQPPPQQPYPQQPYPQQAYPQQQPPPQRPYPQQQPRPQQPPYPYPQQSYPPQPYQQQPYPQQQRYPYPQTVNKHPFPPQPHMASPYRQPYPQQQKQPPPAYPLQPAYPPQQYHPQYMYRPQRHMSAPVLQPQSSCVQIHTGGGVMTFGTQQGGGMMPLSNTVVLGSGHSSMPMQAPTTLKKKGKKKK